MESPEEYHVGVETGSLDTKGAFLEIVIYFSLNFIDFIKYIQDVTDLRTTRLFKRIFYSKNLYQKKLSYFALKNE